ncbi:hypothetical protein AAMO2058_000056500 [Amorphochlora amoebiformis]
MGSVLSVDSPLVMAAKAGNMSEVKKRIDRAKPEEIIKAYYKALKRGLEDVIIFIAVTLKEKMEYDRNITPPPLSLLPLALQTGNPIIVDYTLTLTSFDLDTNLHFHESKESLLTLAAGMKDITLVKFLVDRKASPNTTNMHKETALHKAVQTGDMKMTTLLIDAKADMSMRGGRRRLHVVEIAQMLDAPEMHTLLLNKAFQRVRQLEKEVLDTEKYYVESLEILQKAYLNPLKKRFGQISATLNAILKLHKEIYQLLRDLHEAEIKKAVPFRNSGCCTVIAKFSSYFKLYVQYLISYSAAADAVQTLKKKKDKKLQKLRNTYKTPDGKRVQDIGTYLIMPCQRLSRYRLLLEEIAKKYPKWIGDNDKTYLYTSLQGAIKVLMQSAAHNNDIQRSAETINNVKTIQDRIKACPTMIIAPHRSFISEVQADVNLEIKQEKAVTANAKLYLFSDLFLWSTEKGQREKREKKRERKREKKRREKREKERRENKKGEKRERKREERE